MNLSNLSQPPFDTSFVGVIQGALDYFGSATTHADTFVLTGHAFVTNIHKEICPSGPYCWKWEPIYDLSANIGLKIEHLGDYFHSTPTGDCTLVEKQVVASIDEGAICSCVNLDHQLILGYDESGFNLALPWGDSAPSTHQRLSFGNWAEWSNEEPVSFMRFTPGENVSREIALLDCLAFAVEVWNQPQKYRLNNDYGLGAAAYENWLNAFTTESIDEHGNSWNATVWSECKLRAAEFFDGFSTTSDEHSSTFKQLARDYRDLSVKLADIARPELPVSEKLTLIAEAAQLEEGCASKIEQAIAS